MRVYGNNQPTSVRNGVTEMFECNGAIGHKPPIQFDPCDKLVRNRSTVVVGMDESCEDRERYLFADLGSLDLYLLPSDHAFKERGRAH